MLSPEALDAVRRTEYLLLYDIEKDDYSSGARRPRPLGRGMNCV
jgi:hypothetical protein